MQQEQQYNQSNNNLKYKRILLKLSGEALTGEVKGSDNFKPQMFDYATTMGILQQVKQLVDIQVKVGLVIGGGNIFRGIDKSVEFGLQRVNADYMGMLATIMNGVALRDFLAKIGIKSQVYSAIPVGSIVEGYNRDKMLADLEQGITTIFVGGTGNPLFTTDSAAAIRAIEMGANILIKATKVDGVYDADPARNSNAKKYSMISFDEVIAKNLKIMDMAAFDLCREHSVNIQVCNIFTPNVLKNIVFGQNIGTCVYNGSQ